MKRINLSLSAIIALLSVFPVSQTMAADAATSDDVITVYSSRKEHLIKPLFDRFTAKTGTKVRFITDKAGPLMARLKAEGRRCPAFCF